MAERVQAAESMRSTPVPSYREASSAGPPQLTTNNFLVSISLIVGLFGVVLMSAPLNMKTSEFYHFANYALEVLEQTPFILYATLGSLIVGFAGVCVGCCLGTSGLLSKRFPKLMYLTAFLLLVHAVCTLAVGGLVMMGIDMIDSAIYQQTGNVAAEGTFTANAVHFQLSMFNGCCASRGWTVERFNATEVRGASLDAMDLDGYVKYCGLLHSDNRAEMQDKKMRSCYTYQDTYRAMNSTVGDNLPRICQALSLATTNVMGKKLPGTGIDVVGFTRGQSTIPVVGDKSPPTYGCGIGYAKAFQAAMLIWVENYLQPVSMTFLVIGALELVLLFVVASSNYACNVKKESTDEAYSRYMMELQNEQQAVVVVNSIDDKI